MRNSAPLDELYFDWLYRQVADPDQGLTYWHVLRILYSTEFVWIVSNDENRISDGKELRERFIKDQRIRLRRADLNWIDLGCSMLELMVGLSERLEYLADGKAHSWFWHLMGNIGLSELHDGVDLPEEYVYDVLERIIQRYYEPDGNGGFFPLRRPREDQRQIELWYQLSAYVLEREG